MMTSRQQRTLRGKFVDPQAQFRMAFLSVGGGIVVLGLFVVLTLGQLETSLMNIVAASESDPDLGVALFTTLHRVKWYVGGFSFLLFIASVWHGLTISHHIFGPVVSLRRLVNDLASGNFTARGRLRKNDYFHGMMDDLNYLAETLEKREGQ